MASSSGSSSSRFQYRNEQSQARAICCCASLSTSRCHSALYAASASASRSTPRSATTDSASATAMRRGGACDSDPISRRLSSASAPSVSSRVSSMRDALRSRFSSGRSAATSCSACTLSAAACVDAITALLRCTMNSISLSSSQQRPSAGTVRRCSGYPAHRCSARKERRRVPMRVASSTPASSSCPRRRSSSAFWLPVSLSCPDWNAASTRTSHAHTCAWNAAASPGSASDACRAESRRKAGMSLGVSLRTGSGAWRRRNSAAFSEALPKSAMSGTARCVSHSARYSFSSGGSLGGTSLRYRTYSPNTPAMRLRSTVSCADPTRPLVSRSSALMQNRNSFRNTRLLRTSTRGRPTASASATSKSWSTHAWKELHPSSVWSSCTSMRSKDRCRAVSMPYASGSSLAFCTSRL
mmetsp:Transcript_17058/g.54775  ORF Transcript_17058/g.54775 Transcript_17058/m.54775 type:complete len:412 (-) Transcript_17058:673-1908(-)